MRFLRVSEATLGLLCTAGLLSGCNGAGSTPQTPSRDATTKGVRRASAAAVPVPCPTGTPPVTSPTPPANELVHAFYYTGAEQTWKVPGSVTSLSIKVQGAQGASGLGGCQSGTLSVTPGQTLFIHAGGAGKSNGAGGFNGGGNGGNAKPDGNPGGGGGGASDVRSGGDALSNRIIVAGGGGGASGGGWSGGSGGGQTGGDGATNGNYSDGSGGTQKAGGREGSSYATAGTLGSGGAGAQRSNAADLNAFGGGGGGGGYYGGGGGSASIHDNGLDRNDGGGGGGSGFADSSFANVTASEGVHYGSGSVTISWKPAIKRLAYDLDNPKAIAEDTAGNVYLANANPYITAYRPDGSILYKIGSGFTHVKGVLVDTKQPPHVFVLADAPPPKPGQAQERAVYEVSPPFNTSGGGKIYYTLISQVNILSFAIDEKFLYVLAPCISSGGCTEEATLYPIYPDGAPRAIPSSTLKFDVNTVSLAAGSCVYAQGCVLYAIQTFPAKNSSQVLRFINPPNGSPTLITNGAEYARVVTLGNSAADGGLGLYVTTSDSTVMKLPANEQWTLVGGTNTWNAPIAIAVNPDCPSACSIYVLDDNNGGEIDFVDGFDR